MKKNIEITEEELTKRAKKDMFMEYVPYIIILIFVILIRVFVASPVRVSGQSMEPTLEGGEIMLEYKLQKKLKGINRGDIVVVQTDSNKIIKRVIGLPGETIKYDITTDDEGNITSAKLVVDGAVISEEYLSEEALINTCRGTYNLCDKTFTVSDNHYFVMGDNRRVSNDSRMIGEIPYDKIKGITRVRLFPFSKFGNPDK